MKLTNILLNLNLIKMKFTNKILKWLSFYNLIWLILFFIPLIPSFIKSEEFTLMHKPHYIMSIWGYYYILYLLLGLSIFVNTIYILFIIYSLFFSRYRFKIKYYIIFFCSLIVLIFLVRTRNENINILSFYF